MGFLMKRPKAIPRKFKECLSAYYLNPEHWLLVEEWDFYIKIVHKDNPKKFRYLDKHRQEMLKIEKSIQTHAKGKRKKNNPVEKIGDIV